MSFSDFLKSPELHCTIEVVVCTTSTKLT